MSILIPSGRVGQIIPVLTVVIIAISLYTQCEQVNQQDKELDLKAMKLHSTKSKLNSV